MFLFYEIIDSSGMKRVKNIFHISKVVVFEETVVHLKKIIFRKIIFRKVNQYSIFSSKIFQNHALQIVMPFILRKGYLYLDKLRTKVISQTDKSCIIIPPLYRK